MGIEASAFTRFLQLCFALTLILCSSCLILLLFVANKFLLLLLLLLLQQTLVDSWHYF